MLCVAAEAFPVPAEMVLLSIVFVLDVLTHMMGCVQMPPGVAEGQPVHA